MSKKHVRDIPASILQRLKNYSDEHRENYNLTLSRYAIERFLYRLSISEYSDQFVLKGAQLFSLWAKTPYRPTRDLDLLKYGSSEISELEAVFRTLCELQTDIEDGIVYLPDTVRCEVIREDNEYDGVRIRFEYRIDTTGQSMQIDIGFGDITVPDAEEYTYPSILGFPAAQLKTYCRETLIAEKVQTMVFWGMANTRMKDFFDVYKLSTDFEFEGKLLREAIEATFIQRKTDIPDSVPLVFTTEFSEAKRMQWQAFLNKSDLSSNLIETDFTKVIQAISNFIVPVFESIKKDDVFAGKWTSSQGWKDR